MSATQQLLELLPQLRSLEENIVSMIVELSTKLANLTDAHIFILVDVNNQRKFSGSQYLVDHYLNGGLFPVGDSEVDVELEVSSAPTVLPKNNGSSQPNNDDYQQQQQRQQQRQFRGGGGGNGQRSSSSSTYTPLNRYNGKRSRDGGGGGGFSSSSGSDPTGGKRIKKRNNPNNVKAEPVSFFNGVHHDDVDLTLDETDGSIRVNDHHAAATAASSSRGARDDEYFYGADYFRSNNDDSFSVAEDYGASIRRLFATKPGFVSPSASSTEIAPVMRFEDDTDDMIVRIDDLNLPQQKIDYLQAIHETEKLFVKGSPETKIVTSLMYDLGKSLHVAFVQYVNRHAQEGNPVDPLTLVKPFIGANLDHLLKMLFSHLELDSLRNANIRIENRRPRAFMNRHTLNSFHRIMRENLKALNSSSSNAGTDPMMCLEETGGVVGVVGGGVDIDGGHHSPYVDMPSQNLLAQMPS